MGMPIRAVGNRVMAFLPRDASLHYTPHDLSGAGVLAKAALQSLIILGAIELNGARPSRRALANRRVRRPAYKKQPYDFAFTEHLSEATEQGIWDQNQEHDQTDRERVEEG
jgi:hypothetical protein